ncbi:MAG: hypothetical protein FJZ96_08570 [Chloroflexi bacterium]|nr:hypothetical protein [Chloroflexota bacterium]
MDQLEKHLTPDECRLLANLDSPARIQAWLDTVPYSKDDFYRCPLRVMRDRKAHCFDGALFAAAVLRRIGHRPRILELLPNARDDDHLLAVFKENDAWGAVAQSNYSGLRYREPVFRTLRELTMSYFEDYFNPVGEKTLRGYRGPVDLSSFDRLEWTTSDAGLESLADGIDRYRSVAILTTGMEAALQPVDERSLKAGLVGSNPDGLFKV